MHDLFFVAGGLIIAALSSTNDSNMSASSNAVISPEILEALKQRLGPQGDTLRLDCFIDCVLYDPAAGYYRKQAERVGRSRSADFYTASSLGEVFSRLILCAIQQLCDGPLEEFSFVEAGPEAEGGILRFIENHPFKELHLVRPGDPFEIPPKAVVFSNELFDAQPFRRLVFTDGRWMEMGVRIEGRQAGWTLLETADIPAHLPQAAAEGYLIDWPSGAHALLESICSKPWQGLFLAFDYGLGRQTVLHERPQGTGRTYSEHKMGSNLLHNPGQTDITCHLIWEELEAILAKHRFEDTSVIRQEAFLMRHSGKVIQDILENSPPGLSRQKQTLMELLHPENMGHKFQALSAIRRES